MTERSDGVTDARIQAAKVIAGLYVVSLKGVRRGRTGSRRCLLNAVRESSARSGGREIERGHGTDPTCRANDRADKRLGAGAKQRHEADPEMV